MFQGSRWDTNLPNLRSSGDAWWPQEWGNLVFFFLVLGGKLGWDEVKTGEILHGHEHMQHVDSRYVRYDSDMCVDWVMWGPYILDYLTWNEVFQWLFFISK